ncbi:MAG: hypothetical protein M1817_003867 [Caeruleum heppii]|nr:MAG: hypothetical protein M1817_003867 [Caeruleum heppii]
MEPLALQQLVRLMRGDRVADDGHPVYRCGHPVYPSFVLRPEPWNDCPYCKTGSSLTDAVYTPLPESPPYILRTSRCLPQAQTRSFQGSRVAAAHLRIDTRPSTLFPTRAMHGRSLFDARVAYPWDRESAVHTNESVVESKVEYQPKSPIPRSQDSDCRSTPHLARSPGAPAPKFTFLMFCCLCFILLRWLVFWPQLYWVWMSTYFSVACVPVIKRGWNQLRSWLIWVIRSISALLARVLVSCMARWCGRMSLRSPSSRCRRYGMLPRFGVDEQSPVEIPMVSWEEDV